MALKTNLVSYYKLDETSGTTAVDSNGSNDGTNYGATINITGKINTAYSFNGTSNYIDTNADLQDNVENFSVEAWFKLDNTSGHNVIIQTRGSGGGESLTLSVENGYLTFMMDTNGYYVGRDYNTILNTGIWYHVVGVVTSSSGQTFSPSMFVIYLDGLRVDNADHVTGTITGTSPFNGLGTTKIGYHEAWNSYFSGTIDELGIWGRALTSTEVSELYNNGVGLSYDLFDRVIINADVTVSILSLGMEGNTVSESIWETGLSNQYRFNNELTDYISGNDGTIHVDLDAYYPFNGNANDESDNSNNGTLTSGTIIDSMDSLTGWSADNSSSFISLNTSTFQEGTGAINLFNTVTGYDLQFRKYITTTDLSGRFLSYYIYLTQDVINSYQGGTFYLHSANGFNRYHLPYQDFVAGWNVVNLEVDNPTSSSGTPDMTVVNKISFNIEGQQPNARVVNEGELVFDCISFGIPYKTRDRFGRENKAYHFNGANYENIVVPNISINQNGTISCLIKGEPSQTTNNIYPVSINQKFGLLGPSGSGSRRVGLITKNSANTDYIYYRWDGSTLLDPYDGNWHLYTVSWDNTNIYCWVDGISCGSPKPHNNDIFLPQNSNLNIGSWGSAYGGHSGDIDEVIISDRALNSTEVASLYESLSRHDLNDIYVDGKIDKATDFFNSIVFSQLNSFITMDHENSSICFWANITNEIKSGGASVMNKRRGYSGAQHLFLYKGGSSNAMFFMEPTTNNREVYWAEKSSLSGWHHFALTMDSGGAPKLYVDGIDYGAPDGAQKTVVDNFSLLCIARTIGHNGNYGDAVSTQLDDLRIYKKTLTQHDVTNIYNSGDGAEAIVYSNVQELSSSKLAPIIISKTTAVFSKIIYKNDVTITSAKLDAEYTGALGFEMSADGGGNWESVTPGQIHVFTNTGTGLMWRAVGTNAIINKVEVQI